MYILSNEHIFLFQKQKFKDICHEIMYMPDKKDRDTLCRLVGDAKIAIELGDGEDLLEAKNKNMEKLWIYISSFAIRQAQWNKQIPAQFFILERELIKEGFPFLYMNQIKDIIQKNNLEIVGHALQEFLR